MSPILRAIVWFSCAFLALHQTPVPAPPPSANELRAWLENRESEWVATVHLQRDPKLALALLLEPGRVRTGPHDQWTASMLALAKLGEPAIPAITGRVIAILQEDERSAFGAAHPLIKVLGSMGPAAVPALVQIAETSRFPYVTRDALEEIVRLERKRSGFGQPLSAWHFWKPVDTYPDQLRRQLEPQLSRLRQVMERARAAWKPQGPAPERAAAYVLARWGSGETRLRGVQVLEELARAEEPFYYNLEAVRLLHALRAPSTSGLIRRVAERVPDSNDLKGAYRLRMAIALHQLGDRDYAPLFAAALREGRPYDRIDAAQYIRSSGDVALGALLVPLLEDHSEWNGRTVAQTAVGALQHLTFQELPPEVRTWRAWFEGNSGVSRDTLFAARVKARLATMRQAPILEANRWMEEFDGSEGVGLLALIDRYLERRDLDAGTVGPGSNGGSVGMSGPHVVTVLLEMSLRGVPGARDRLIASLKAADPNVRMFGALALAAFDRRRAIDHLAVEARNPEAWHRARASEFLLRLGDKRGIPARIEALADQFEPTRVFACRDLRVYTQEPLLCDATTWQAWWKRTAPTFLVASRAAELDLQVYAQTSSIHVGGSSIR